MRRQHMKAIFANGRKAADRFWAWKYFMPLILLIACIGTIFDAALPAMFILVAIATLLLVFCDDLLSIACPLMSIFLCSIEFYKDYSVLTEYMWYAIIPFAAAVVFNLIYYRRPFVRGRFFYPQLAVSIALCAGGLFCISAKEYFSPAALYHSIGCGFFMLFIYYLCSSRMSANRRSYDRTEIVARTIYAAGLLAAFLVFNFYIDNLESFIERGSLLFFKPRNFVSSILMMALPMSCIYIKRNDLHIVPLLLMYLAMLMTGSRSGLIFGTFSLLCSLAYVYFTNKKSRRLYNTLLIIAIIPVAYATIKFIPSLYSSRLSDGFFNAGDATRIKFIKYGISDFLQYPIFGIGMGNLAHFEIFKAYTPGSIVYFHNIVIQVMASMGLIGIFAYLFNFATRLKLLWQNRRNESTVFAISYFAILLMSLTNPGIFCPFPEAAMLIVMFAATEYRRER